MAECDRAAVRVHVRRVVRQTRVGASPPAPAPRTLRSVRSRRCRQSSACDARAAFCVAGAGPIPIMRGGTPAVATPRSRAIGFNPYLPTARSLAISTATAPSLMPDALPAVTLPSGLTTPFNFDERIERGLARMFILGDHRIALLAGNVDSDDLVVEEPARVRRRIALLRSQRECILIGTRDAEITARRSPPFPASNRCRIAPSSAN